MEITSVGMDERSMPDDVIENHSHPVHVDSTRNEPDECALLGLPASKVLNRSRFQSRSGRQPSAGTFEIWDCDDAEPLLCQLSRRQSWGV